MNYLIIVPLCILFGAPTSYSQRMTIQTCGQPFATYYSYFPLRTNFLDFSVKATNDIHIALTNSNSKALGYYEIVIGGWQNSKSAIRKDTDAHRVEHLGAIINTNEFQRFWVRINDTEGSISVGKQDGEPFMYFKDPAYNKMSYFGISTGFGSKGEWNFDFGMFDCGVSSNVVADNHLP